MDARKVLTLGKPAYDREERPGRVKGQCIDAARRGGNVGMGAGMLAVGRGDLIGNVGGKVTHLSPTIIFDRMRFPRWLSFEIGKAGSRANPAPRSHGLDQLALLSRIRKAPGSARPPPILACAKKPRVPEGRLAFVWNRCGTSSTDMPARIAVT